MSQCSISLMFLTQLFLFDEGGVIVVYHSLIPFVLSLLCHSFAHAQSCVPETCPYLVL